VYLGITCSQKCPSSHISQPYYGGILMQSRDIATLVLSNSALLVFQLRLVALVRIIYKVQRLPSCTSNHPIFNTHTLAVYYHTVAFGTSSTRITHLPYSTISTWSRK